MESTALMQPPIGLDEKSILERIVSRFLNLRQGTPSRSLRISLGQKRGILDQLSNAGYLKTVADQYVPTYKALDPLDPALRQTVNHALDAVFTALKDLYVSQDKSSFTFEEILIAVRDVDPALDENDILPALAFATDFDFFVSWSGPSGDQIRITNVSLSEKILDFHSTEQEWKRILMARESAERMYATTLAQHPVSPGLSHAPSFDFTFVCNPKLRKIVDRDYSELQMAKRVSASKTRLILSGGLIEALLLDALETNLDRALIANAAERGSKGKVKPLDDWNLSSLIDVAAELSLISDGSAKLSAVIRDFRNLVHPGKEKRGDYIIEEHEAEAAEAGLNAVIRDLRARSRGKM